MIIKIINVLVSNLLNQRLKEANVAFFNKSSRSLASSFILFSTFKWAHNATSFF